MDSEVGDAYECLGLTFVMIPRKGHEGQILIVGKFWTPMTSGPHDVSLYCAAHPCLQAADLFKTCIVGAAAAATVAMPASFSLPDQAGTPSSLRPLSMPCVFLWDVFPSAT